MKKTLTMKENKRLQVMQEVMAREKTVEAASKEVGVSERHAYRILARVKEHGAFGIAHGNRGRPSPFKMSDELRAQVIELRRGTYAGFNDRHFADELKEEEDLKIGRETVRKLLRGAGIASMRKVKKRKHRRRRVPMEKFGELLQGDGSSHDWLEGRGPELTLLHFVDDATGYEWGDFFYSETTEGYYRVMMSILKVEGIPRRLYVDRHSVFHVNLEDSIEEQFTGRRPLTQFARAMEELAIPITFAKSPQAKGKVERSGGVDQDRLVSELRKANASTLEEARAVLKKYLRKRNRWFAKKPAKNDSAFIPLPEGCDLKQILCWKEERVVANDNTISFHGKKFQIPASPWRHTFAKAKVAVHLCIDGSIHVFHKRQRIAFFKNGRVDPGMVPIISISSAALTAHSPTLTFSLGH
jgi:transposase